MSKQNSTQTEAAGLAGAFKSLKNKPTTKWVLIAVVAVIVIIGGYIAYNQFVVKPADEKAQSQLATGIQLLNQAQQLSSQNAQIQAMSDSSLVSALSAQGMLAAVDSDSIAIYVAQFRESQLSQTTTVLNQALRGDGTFPGFIKLSQGSGAAANLATYLAGVAYYYLGQYKEAIKCLEDYSPKGDAGVSPMALSALANCYACDKQYDKAVEAFKEAADEADNESLSPIFLIEAGKILESQNKKAEANAIYTEVKTKYPKYGMTRQGMTSSEVDKYIERTK